MSCVAGQMLASSDVKCLEEHDSAQEGEAEVAEFFWPCFPNLAVPTARQRK